MTFREINLGDAGIITRMRMRMLEEVTDEPLPEGLDSSVHHFIMKHMLDNTCLGMVAEQDGQVIADAVIYIFETMPDEVNVSGLTAMLYNVYTLPEYRGQGIGAQMLQYATAFACKHGGQTLTVSVFAADRSLIEWYRQHGFVLRDVITKNNLPLEVACLEKDLRGLETR